MQDKDKLIKSAIASVLAITAINTAMITPSAAATTQETEKCYGVSKAGMNDCQTSTNSCAGSAKVDSQADAFLFMPTGLCSKIVGGSLTVKTAEKK